MLVKRNWPSIERKHKVGLLILLFVSIFWVAFSMVGGDNFDLARREVLLRRVGHEILLQSGDSTSRVLPVKRIAENEYQISFEHAFTFQPASLVSITQRLLAKGPLARDYVVNVLNCASASVVYGYAISKNKKDDIVACIGRWQPIACYMINIKFKPTGIITAQNGFLLGSLSVLALVGFIFLRPVKQRRSLPDSQDNGLFTLGSMSFDAEARKLMIDGKTSDLTRTESRVLRIFALSPNEAMERSWLQKEIWEDEGVIVGRSLDLFISKLLKKLKFDTNVKIVVIRGKGYKLEIST